MTLYQRRAKHHWVEVSHVSLTIGTLGEALRRLADLARGEGDTADVTVWLPKDQLKLVPLPEKDGPVSHEDKLAAAAAFVAGEPHVFDIETGGAQNSPCLVAVPLSVLQETKDFLEAHGFTLHGYTTQEPVLHLDRSPYFSPLDPPREASAKAVHRYGVLAGATAAALIAVVGIGFGVSQLIQNDVPTLDPSIEANLAVLVPDYSPSLDNPYEPLNQITGSRNYGPPLSIARQSRDLPTQFPKPVPRVSLSYSVDVLPDPVLAGVGTIPGSMGRPYERKRQPYGLPWQATPRDGEIFTTPILTRAPAASTPPAGVSDLAAFWPMPTAPGLVLMNDNPDTDTDFLLDWAPPHKLTPVAVQLQSPVPDRSATSLAVSLALASSPVTTRAQSTIDLIANLEIAQSTDVDVPASLLDPKRAAVVANLDLGLPDSRSGFSGVLGPDIEKSDLIALLVSPTIGDPASEDTPELSALPTLSSPEQNTEYAALYQPNSDSDARPRLFPTDSEVDINVVAALPDVIPPTRPEQGEPEEPVDFVSRGVLDPKVVIIAALPDVMPTLRPRSAVVDAPNPNEEAISALILKAQEDALEPSDLALTSQDRPPLRPAAIEEAELARIAALTPSENALTSADRPRKRPLALASIAPSVPRNSSPSVVTRSSPQLPTTASVARAATIDGAIPLRKTSLIGVFGGKSNRHALLRLSNGRMIKVAPGDQVDGQQVVAISSDAIRLRRRGRDRILVIPR